MPPGGVGGGNAIAAQRRRDAFLEQVRGGATVTEAMDAVGWTTRDSYLQNRKRDPRWAAEVDLATGMPSRERQMKRRTNDSHHGGPRHREGDAVQVYGKAPEFMDRFKGGMTVNEAVAAVGWSPAAYRKTRSRDSEFAAEVDAILEARVPPGSKPPRDRNGRLWSPGDGFLKFRQVYLRTDSPWFHLLAIDAMEAMPPGSLLHILWPPEHGKTRLWEDYFTYLLCIDPSRRITVGSEKLTQATKISRFVRDRFERDATGFEPMRRDFGPFAPLATSERRELREQGHEDAAAAQQAWGVAGWNVRKKPTGLAAERDYNVQAIGMSGSIIGTRCDELNADDPQGQKSLQKKDNTKQLVETFRQDWLSRPGPTGRTRILANRVGPGDFHEELIENTDIVDRVIALPAWDKNRGGWLWPERYSPDDYRGMKRRVGEDAWDRNFMQKGLANRQSAFNDVRIGKSKNPLRSILHNPPRPPGGGEQEIIIGIDPGHFKASFHVAAVGDPNKFLSLDLRLLENAKAYGVYGDVVDELCMQFHRPGLCVVSKVIVETKAFQYGLLQDDRLLEAALKFGFELVPFETGMNKYDPDLGIPQIGRLMDRGLFDFPDMDQQSKDRYAPLYYQMRRWKEGVRGNKLEQDHVMSFWFCAHEWKLRRRIVSAGDGITSSFDFRR